MELGNNVKSTNTNTHTHHLNMQWNILGSNLPIFGSEGHPAISLRLRYLTLF